MDNNVVDTTAAVGKLGGNSFDMFFITWEKIQSKRLFLIFKLIYNCIKTLKSQDGHNRAEDLLAHYGIVVCYIIHNGGCDLAGIDVCIATDNNLVFIN